jgi:hypothetical protein
MLAKPLGCGARVVLEVVGGLLYEPVAMDGTACPLEAGRPTAD